MNVCTLNNFILPFSGFFICFLAWVVFPIIFNKKIIPDIEKRIGKKLKFTAFPIYYLVPKSWVSIFWWGEVALYITGGYCGCLTKWARRDFALGVVKYDVKHQSPCHEIIFSILGVFLFILFFLAVILGYYIKYMHPECKI